MLFNTMLTILLGILGGIVSSLIVSRVFFIHGEYRNQLKTMDHVIRKLGLISGFIQSIKIIFKVDYDQDITMKEEMREKGYKSDMDYYRAHSDKRWISTDGVLHTIKTRIDEAANSLISELFGICIDNKQLNTLLNSITAHLHEITSVKKYTFDCIEKFEQTEQTLINQYEDCTHASGRTVLKMLLKDRFMIVMYCAIAVIIAGVIITGIFGI